MIVSHLLLILHKKIQFYIFMFEAWNVAKGRKGQGGRILSQGTVDALNLTQIIMEPTRYNPKSVNTGTLIEIILTNLPSKYTSAVFNQDPSDHCLIARIRKSAFLTILNKHAPFKKM